MALLAIGVSALFILLLCAGDPKRRRNAAVAGKGYGLTARRLLVLGILLPGIACLARGDGAAFFLWMGGCAVVGWAVTLLLAQMQGGSKAR